MNPILLKIFATALAFSQVTTQPDAIKTELDPVADRAAVVQLLRDGCTHMRKAFDIEDINLDELISIAMDDKQAMAGEIKAFKGLNFGDLHLAYRQFCKNEPVDNPAVDLGEVIRFYNKAAADLPDHTKLKHMRLPGMSVVLDRAGERFADIFEPEQRRLWVPLSDVPELVQKAFVAAEDKRFFEHKGIDERGLVRAFIGNLTSPGRPQGGSTITQQVAKNLLVGDDVTYERKIREMIVASRLERTLTKQEILELYLNSIYLGRGAWGIEMAARSYFGKSAKDLDLAEGALLAGLTKGPNYFAPDRHEKRARERLDYVLGRLREDGAIDRAQERQAAAQLPKLVTAERLRRDSGFYFVDYLGREAKSVAGIESLTGTSYTVRSTINPALQRATETALQDGLAHYELNTGRMQFHGPELNLADTVKRIAEADAKSGAATSGAATSDALPPWRQALAGARLPLYDVHWMPAIVTEKTGDKRNGEVVRVGLPDGRIVPLNAWTAAIRRSLKPYDVVYVRLRERKGKSAVRADLRIRPEVQGAAVVLENKTGRILAMTGGFSYPLSQLNRASQSQRQPGSAIKPLTYLAALRHGLQPNTLVRDAPITLPPISGHGNAREEDYWTPKNYDGGASGVITLRQALEHSKNLVTARLLDGGIESAPEQSLDRVCELALEAQLYSECVRYYPFVLGAQPVRLLDLAAFYAAVANEGARPSPYAIESVEQNGLIVYRHEAKEPIWLGSADRAAFFQLRTMLQGVLQRGTARAIASLAPYVGGKTGTSDNENDAWFVGFTNDITVAVWVGYDNAEGRRRTLGGGQTGAKVAIPIFEPIVQAAWAGGLPRTALAKPSPEAQRQLVALPIDLATGERVTDGRAGAFTEYFHLDRTGRFTETQYRLVSRDEAYIASREVGDGESVYGMPLDRYGDGYYQQQPYGQRYGYQQQYPGYARPYGYQQPYYGYRQQYPGYQQQYRGYQPRWGGADEMDEYRRSRRLDPDYLWGSRRYN